VTYDVTVFGTLRFPRGKLRAWRADWVDSRAFRSTARVFPKRPHLAPVTVESLIEELPTISGHGLFRIDAEGGEVVVRGRFTQAAFESRSRQLAALFLLSAQFGAEGDICFLGDGVFVGYGVSVGGGKGSLVALSADQVQNASMHPELDVISGYFVIDPPPTSAPPTSLDMPRTGLIDVPGPKRP
jgi:hypothetical protein